MARCLVGCKYLIVDVAPSLSMAPANVILSRSAMLGVRGAGDALGLGDCVQKCAWSAYCHSVAVHGRGNRVAAASNASKLCEPVLVVAAVDSIGSAKVFLTLVRSLALARLPTFIAGCVNMRPSIVAG